MGISCLFGHKYERYSDWGEDKCHSVCARCKKSIDRPHDYQPTDNPCQMRCSRCGGILYKEHDFQPVAGKCVGVCSRCGAEAPDSTANHKWKRVPQKCVERCTVCGKERSVAHTWKQVRGKCIPVCSVCGAAGNSWNAKHTWQPVPGKCEEKCAYCDKTQPMKHEYKNGKCVRCGRDINEPENGSIPPLLWAAVEGDVQEVKALIAGGADVNRYGPDETPLIGAAGKGYDAAHKEIVRLLLDAGANINATDMYGRTALECAARKGLNDMVSYLASRGGR